MDRKVEYQLISVKENGEIEVRGKYNYITPVITEVTEENKQMYPMLEIGQSDTTFDREKISEFIHRFPADTTMGSINDFLKFQASYFGEVVNE